VQATKRQCTSGPATVKPPLNDKFFHDEYRSRTHSLYMTAQPFKHMHLTDLVSDHFLDTVRSEILNSLPSTFKESDIFKLFQTMDLASLELPTNNNNNNSSIAHIVALRDALYSAEFRAFLSEVTECGELTDRVDMSANVYGQGHHLLCHDDVIGNRKLSFIIYLPDRSSTWTVADGGCLELYLPLPDSGAVNACATCCGEQSVVPTKVLTRSTREFAQTCNQPTNQPAT
jgi:prolyl 3-hydroxylase /prolyl 3,4-dihydroxylase